MDYEQFVTVWQSSKTAKEACKKLNVSKVVAIARACFLRRNGVNLKKMPRGKCYKPGVNASKLNALIAGMK